MSTDLHRPSSGLISASRITTLLVSGLVALCSGTNYVYSAYGPQLGARLGLNHTQQNLVGLSGNAGVYCTGPFLGRLVDAKGPRIPLAMALVFLFVGYFGIKTIFDAGSGDPISTITLTTLLVCSFMTGAGGNGGLASSINSVAKSFPDTFRTTTTGFVLSGFGLSAFLFSTIAHAVFPGNTSDFLLVLAVGTSLPMILGWIFIRPIPYHDSEGFLTFGAGEADREYEAVRQVSGTDSPSAVFEREDTGYTRLLADHDGDPTEQPICDHDPRRANSSYVVPGVAHGDVQLSPTFNYSSRRAPPRRLSFDETGVTLLGDGLPNLSGRTLFATIDFWLLFIITSLLSGTGVMWINNVGSVAQALLAKGNPDYDDVESSRWQSIQVSTVSVMNFAGRICIGVIADFTKNRLSLRRTYCISLVALMFLVSQFMAISIADVHDLHKASAMLGFAYGSMFGLFPTITIEWFGIAHFSENWGLVSLAPLLGGNLLSLAFGRNLDSHIPAPSDSQSTAQCLIGVECYVASLHLTVGACIVALVLAVWAGLRDRRKLVIVSKVKVPEEVVWDVED